MESIISQPDLNQYVKARILREQAYRSKLVTQIRHHDSSPNKKKQVYVDPAAEESQNKIRILIQAARSATSSNHNESLLAANSLPASKLVNPRNLSPIATPEMNFRGSLLSIASSMDSSLPNMKKSRGGKRTKKQSQSLTSLNGVSEFESVGETGYNQDLVSDIHGVFREVYRNKTEEKQTKRKFTTRLSTPPGLFGDQSYGKSRHLMNSMIDDVHNLSATIDNDRKSWSTITATANELQDSFRREKLDYESIALYVETKYIEMKQHQAQYGILPTRIKAAVCMDLLIKLSTTLGRYSSMMEPLLWEICNCLFVEFPEQESRFTAENFLNNLLGVRTYFELYQEAHDALEDISSEIKMIQQGIRLKDIVKKFQTVRLAFDATQGFVRNICFKAWKILWVRGLRLRRISRRKCLQYRFKRWILFVQHRNERQMEEFSHLIDNKIQQLSQLNDIISTHNTEELSKKSGKRSLIVFGRSSSMDYDAIESARQRSRSKSIDPIQEELTLTDNANENKTAAKKKLSKQQSFLSDVTNRISETLQSVTIATEETGLIPTEAGSLPITPRETDSPVMKTTFPELEPIAPGADLELIPSNYKELSNADKDMILDRVEHALKLTSRILVEQRDEMTQTPDDWMQHVHEDHPHQPHGPKSSAIPVPWTMLVPQHNSETSSLRSFGSISMSLDQREMDAEPFINLHAPSTMIDEESESIQASKQIYQLNASTATQLVSFIYESKLSELIHQNANYEVSYWEKVTMLQFVKESVLKRYRIRRVANKFYKGLLLACIQQSINSRRLELFSMLCGIATPDRSNVKYTAQRCAFFFKMLAILCHNELDDFINMFASQEVDRGHTLEIISIMFEEMQEQDGDLYNDMVFELVDLPATQPELIDCEYKINVDEALLIIMEYYDKFYTKK